jgi:hypothetical protein
MDRDGSGASALGPLHLPSEEDKNDYDRPSPPAVHEVKQKEIMGHREAHAV